MPKRSVHLPTSLTRDFLVIGLALLSVTLLAFEVTAEFTYEQLRAIEVLDTFIALFFLGEYLYSVVRAKEQWRYAWTHWYDLLAAIPITSETTQLLRGLRLFRLVRLLRVVRLVARVRILYRHARRFAIDARLFAIALSSFGLIVFGALVFYLLEVNVNPNVNTFFDSLWWTLVTVTTVGYGDLFPVTAGGRVVAILLMLGGIAIFGTLTAGIASYVLNARTRGPRRRRR